MKISAAQRKALEAAGYTIGKSGSTIQNKSGGTVGGYNENGKVFSGSKKVRDILSGTTEAPKAAPKTVSKAAPKATKPKDKPISKNAMTGYRAGDITTTSLDKPKVGRGNGAAEVKRRKTDSFVNTMKTAIDKAPSRAAKPQTDAEKRLKEAEANTAAADRKMKAFEDAKARRDKSRNSNQNTNATKRTRTAVGTNPFTGGNGFSLFGWGDKKR